MKLRKFLLWLLAAAMLCSLTACGGAASESSDMNYNSAGARDEMSGELVMDSESQSVQTLPENRKLIKTVRMDAETETLDEMLSNLDAKIAELGGYVESREVYNGSAYSQHRYRSANLTIRIPEEKLDSLVGHVSGISNIVSSNESVEDITLQYVDTESRVKALEAEEARLLELMEQAETMEELLAIEGRLTEVRYQLESYASQLRTYDNLVNYATVHLDISEVQEYTPVVEKTVWQRISGGFVDSLEGVGEGTVDFLVWLLANSPYLVVYAAIGTGIGLLLRKVRKQRGKKNPPPEKTE